MDQMFSVALWGPLLELTIFVVAMAIIIGSAIGVWKDNKSE